MALDLALGRTEDESVMGTKNLFLIDVSRRATAYQFPAPPAQKRGLVDGWLRHFRLQTHVTENTSRQEMH